MSEQTLTCVGNCGACRHWDTGAEAKRIQRVRTELSGKDAQRYGTCRAVTLGYTDSAVAFTQDGSDYMADLHTREDFGCVLFEPRGA